MPNHPPRPGRRKPAEESSDSITTQLFIGQDRSPNADGSTQALSSEELARLRSMVSADGTDATEVLSLEELRQLAAADAEDEQNDIDVNPRRVKPEDIAEAESASAPKQWNPQGAPAAESPHPEPWNSGFGAQGQDHGRGQTHGQGQAHGQPSAVQQPSGRRISGAPAFGSSAGSGRPNTGGTPHPGAAAYPATVANPAAPQQASYGSGPSAPAANAAYAGMAANGAGGGPYGPNGGGHGPGGPGGTGGPGGYGSGGPYRRESETKKVPAWLWILAAIALVLALGIVGYIAWDSMQSDDKVASGSSSGQPSDNGGSTPATDGPKSSQAPVADESFTSPSGNISCTIDAERTRCVIASFDYKAPAKPDDCQLENWGSVVVANTDGAGFSCREAPETSGPARVLGYGESVSADGMTCTSTKEGMTCKADSSGVGFNMRRASVDFLD